MFDLGIDSYQTRTLEELLSLVIAMACCIAVVVLIGTDVIIVAIIIRYAIPVLAELAQRAWRRLRSRLAR